KLAPSALRGRDPRFHLADNGQWSSWERPVPLPRHIDNHQARTSVREGSPDRQRTQKRYSIVLRADPRLVRPRSTKRVLRDLSIASAWTRCSPASGRNLRRGAVFQTYVGQT